MLLTSSFALSYTAPMEETGQMGNTPMGIDRQQKGAKKTARYVGYVGVILIPFVSFLLGLTVGYSQARQDTLSWYGPSSSGSIVGENIPGRSASAPKVDLRLLWESLEKVEALYIDPSKINYQSMAYGAVRGIIATLEDPYTSFMNPQESETFNDVLSGDLEGIGAELAERDGHLVVVAPLKGSPAEKAGLLPADILYKIDSESTANLTLTEAVAKIRGKPGTKVVLTIIRGDETKPLDIAIERQAIKVPSVELKMLEGGYANIIVSQFGSETTKEFNKIINQLLIKKPKGIIVDLRNNGGGYLSAATELGSEFIANGILTIIKKRLSDGSWDEEVQRATGIARLENIPLVVLINEGSASASEIFAGAMHDHGRAKLVGNKTFGKGTVQDLISLSDGSTLRITTAQWLTPNGVNIHKVGIMPDVTIELDPAKKDKDGTVKDLQLDKAIEVLRSEVNSPLNQTSP